MWRFGFALAFATLLAVGALSFKSSAEALSTARWVSHTHKVLETLNQVAADVLETESSRRGYVLSGDPILLESHAAARASLDTHLAELGILTSDNPRQQAVVRKLEDAARAKVADTEASLDHFAAQPKDLDWQSQATRSRGIPLMQEFKRLAAEIRAEEEKLLAAREAEAATGAGQTRLAIGLGSLLAVGLFTFTSLRLRRESSERRRAEEALQLREEQVRLAVAAAGVGTWHWDLKTGVVIWSDTMKAMFGMEREAALGDFLQYLHPDDRERVKTAVTDAIERHVDYDTEYRLLRPDGAERWIAARGAGHVDEAGRTIRLHGIVLDISARKRADEQLRLLNGELREQSRRALEATRAKSDFLAGMSHELRTPLNAVIGFAELLHDGKVGGITPEQKECLADILTSGRHLLRVIGDVLDLAKVEAGRLEFFSEPVDPGLLAREVRDIVRALAGSKRITVGIEADPALPEVVVDPARLKQVLYNYVSNALKFTPEGGRVVIRVRPEGPESFRVEVEDNGQGIAPEERDRLFVEFEQLDAKGSPAHVGTGLGLALTKRIVEAQGGTVGVEPRAPGSVFYAVLPRVARGGTTEASSDRPGSLGGPTVLVVEDEAAERDWLVRVLEGAGYAVETAATGRQALERCRQRTFQAITLDLILPDMSGWDVLRGIREGGPSRESPVVVVSVLADKDVGHGVRIDDYLAKPAEARDLLAALRRARALPGRERPVLVVDDDPETLRLCARTLQDAGYRTVCCADGRSGLEAAAHEPPSVVVLDLLMPEMDGFEFLDRFRRAPTVRGTPVIVWTNKDLTAEDRHRLREMAQNVMLKSHGGIAALVEELRGLAGTVASKPAEAPPPS